MQSYVYILGDHEEHGTTNAVATLDRSRLPAMIEDYFAAILGQPGYTDRPEMIAKAKAEDLEGLASVLAQSDEALASTDSPHPLSHGWGGLTLTVARLV